MDDIKKRMDFWVQGRILNMVNGEIISVDIDGKEFILDRYSKYVVKQEEKQNHEDMDDIPTTGCPICTQRLEEVIGEPDKSGPIIQVAGTPKTEGKHKGEYPLADLPPKTKKRVSKKGV